MSQKLQNQTLKRQEMLKFVPDTWPSYMLVVQPLIAVSAEQPKAEEDVSPPACTAPSTSGMDEEPGRKARRCCTGEELLNAVQGHCWEHQAVV